MFLNFVADKDCINQYHFEISIRKKPNRMATLDLDGKTERQSSSLPTRKTKVFITRAIHHTIFFLSLLYHLFCSLECVFGRTINSDLKFVWQSIRLRIIIIVLHTRNIFAKMVGNAVKRCPFRHAKWREILSLAPNAYITSAEEKCWFVLNYTRLESTTSNGMHYQTRAYFHNSHKNVQNITIY